MMRLQMVALALAAVGVAARSDGCPLAVNTGGVGSCMFGSCAASRGPTECTRGTCYCQEGYCRYPASTVHLTSRYCVQRVPNNTCHLTRVCYKAGLTSSFCEKGLCMCKFGYHLGEAAPTTEKCCQCKNGKVGYSASGSCSICKGFDTILKTRSVNADCIWKTKAFKGAQACANGCRALLDAPLEHGVCVINGPPGLALSAMGGNLTGAEGEELAEILRKEDMAVSLNVLLFSLYVTLASMAVTGGAVFLRRKLRAHAAEEVADYKLLAA